MRAREVQINLRINPRESRHLDTMARRSQLTRSAYLRHLINGFQPKEAPPADYYALMREMHAIGNNLNQLAHRANCTGEMDAGHLEAAAAELRQAIKDITRKVIVPEPIAQGGQSAALSSQLTESLAKLIDTATEWEE